MNSLKSELKIIPSFGFYEMFSPFSFTKLWKINNSQSWQLSPSDLEHKGFFEDTLELNDLYINHYSYGLYFRFSLRSDNSYIRLNSGIILKREKSQNYLQYQRQSHVIMSDAEILVMFEHGHLFVWIDGRLCIDQESSSTFGSVKMDIKGNVAVKFFFLFSEAKVHITYFNALGDPMQEMILKDNHTVSVKIFLYDKLRRQSVTIETFYLQKSTLGQLLNYRTDLVTNGNPSEANSVWESGELTGFVENTVGKYGFYQTVYHSNPLNEILVKGMPGDQFSINGPFVKRFYYRTEIDFINFNYKPNDGYTYHVEHLPTGVDHIKVYNSNFDKVAWHVDVPVGSALFSTYEYDSNRNLIRTLPPLYHEAARTLQGGFVKTAQQLTELKKWVSHYTYNGNGKILSKKIPDSGKEEFVYNIEDQLIFIIYYSNDQDESVENVVYFQYDEIGQLSNTGRLLVPVISKEDLLALNISQNNSEVYQQFSHSNKDHEPIWRSRLKRTTTFNKEGPFIEEVFVGESFEKVLRKSIIIPIEIDEKPVQFININQNFVADKVQDIFYPSEVNNIPFVLTYIYDLEGHISEIRTPSIKSPLAKYEYSAKGQITSEHFLPSSETGFKQRFSYNSAGFLSELKSIFMTQNVFYTSGSYGGHGHGDGTVTKTEFYRHWHNTENNKSFGINELDFVSNILTEEDSKRCFKELSLKGYIDEKKQQKKYFTLT